MNKKLLPIILGFSLFVISCEKDSTTAVAPSQSIDNVKVPENFDWSTSKDVSLSIGISDTRYGDAIQVIKIYAGDPSKGGQLVTKGSATLKSPFNTKIALPTSLTEIYVVKVAPDGSTDTQKIALTSNNISASIGSQKMSNSTSYSNYPDKMTIRGLGISAVNTTAPNCQRSTTSTNIELVNPEVVCFSASSDAIIDIKANKGGTVKISAPNKTITIRNFNHTALNLIIENSTKVIITSAELKSNETWTVNGTLQINSELDVYGTLNNNNTATINFLQINSNGLVNNNCKLLMIDFINDATLNNYGYVLAINDTRLNSNSKVNLIGNSTSGVMFQIKNLLRGTGRVSGTGTTSLFKVEGAIDNNLLVNAKQTNNSQIITGNVELCTNVSNIPSGFFIAPAKAGCNAYVVKSDCMLVGNGTLPVNNDVDGDGVVNSEDDYPGDAGKAYNNYSVNYNNGGSTVAFEDSWPSKGDYDLNDVVLSYKYLIVTNASNKVVNISADYVLLATGGDFKNGGGIQFNLPAENIKNFSGSTGTAIESGQDSLVVILFNNGRNEQLNWNTKVGEPVSANKNYNISFDVTNGPSLGSFGIGTYNPFIWNNSADFGRGYETHLYGRRPTKLANNALFGTKDDRSVSAKYYGTANKMPWAIEIPIASFKYPAEKMAINDAYLKFVSWAESGGATYTDWYNVAASGYINSSKLFNK